MSAARLNSRALTVRGTLPQIGSFSLGRRGSDQSAAIVRIADLLRLNGYAALQHNIGQRD